MPTPSSELIRTLASLKASRALSWTQQTAIDLSNLAITAEEPYGITGNARPSAAGDGYSVLDQAGDPNLGFWWRLQLEDDAHQIATFTVAAVHDSEHYHVYVDGNDFDYTSDGTATAAEITAGLKALLDAGLVAVGITTLVTSISGTSDEILTIQADESVVGWETRYEFKADATTSGSLTLVQTPSTIDYEIWVQLADQGLSTNMWDLHSSGTATMNKSVWVDAPGVSRVKIVISDGDGLVTPMLGVPQIEV